MIKRRIYDIVMKVLIWSFSFITIGVLVWILLYLIINGASHISWKFLTTGPSKGVQGIFPFIFNTLYIILTTVIIATPIGIFSAIFLVEYAKQGKLVRIIRFATETLAGIPSIIYGLFGYIFFVSTLHLRWSLISGTLTLSIMVLPTIVRTTEEALKSVPQGFREGSLALGATKLRTIFKVVLPTAIPGILTAVILSIGRVVGETAAVFLTFGTAVNLVTGLKQSGSTLAVRLYVLALEGISNEAAYATALILLFIVAAVNLAANMMAKKLKKLNTID